MFAHDFSAGCAAGNGSSVSVENTNPATRSMVGLADCPALPIPGRDPQPSSRKLRFGQLFGNNAGRLGRYTLYHHEDLPTKSTASRLTPEPGDSGSLIEKAAREKSRAAFLLVDFTISRSPFRSGAVDRHEPIVVTSWPWRGSRSGRPACPK